MTWPIDDEAAALTRLTDLVTPMAVRVAATLRVADHVAKGTTSVTELAQEVGANLDALHRLLRYLAARGVFAFFSPDHVKLTDAAEVLRSDHPRNVRAALDLGGALGRADQSLVELLHVVQTGEPGYPRRYGKGFWDDLKDSHELTTSFDALMSSGRPSSPLPQLLALDWTDTTHLFDIGGGNGNTLVRLLDANSRLRGTLVDRPATAATARAHIREAGLGDRCDVVAGSFFDTLPTGGDTYLLALILHDWPDAEAELILRQCVRAAGPGGRVLIGDLIATDDSDVQLFTHFDLRMLTYFAGRERNLDDFRALTDAAGLTITSVSRIERSRAALIDCRVPRTPDPAGGG